MVTFTIPPELEKKFEERAAGRNMPVEEVVREALRWYLQTAPELLDELQAWQEIRDQAWDVMEGSTP